MGIKDTIKTAVASAMAGAFADCTVRVRIGGNEYSGIRSSLEKRDRAGSMASIQGATGAVRLIVSQLIAPLPVSGTEIEVEETPTEYVTRFVLAARYDQSGATVRLDYGDKYG